MNHEESHCSATSNLFTTNFQTEHREILKNQRVFLRRSDLKPKNEKLTDTKVIYKKLGSKFRKFIKRNDNLLRDLLINKKHRHYAHNQDNTRDVYEHTSVSDHTHSKTKHRHKKQHPYYRAVDSEEEYHDSIRESSSNISSQSFITFEPISIISTNSVEALGITESPYPKAVKKSRKRYTGNSIILKKIRKVNSENEQSEVESSENVVEKLDKIMKFRQFLKHNNGLLKTLFNENSLSPGKQQSDAVVVKLDKIMKFRRFLLKNEKLLQKLFRGSTRLAQKHSDAVVGKLDKVMKFKSFLLKNKKLLTELFSDKEINY